MRLSREAKAQHHEEITAAASKMLRERGIERTSVVDLMQAAGLTHGGFYRHFKSKDELVASSAAKAFEEVVDRFETRTERHGPKAALTAYVLEYLSDTHRDDPTIGCMVSACGAEASRQADVVREAFTAGIRKLLELAEEGLSCAVDKRTERAIELGGLMLGALVMARASIDAALSETILSDAKRRALEIINQED
ncbi:TetR/AcrR family transcriptional regulator [Hyphomicrobium sp.]|uniref:TetR/AcrR family transcriptional regulator n=1 Tax=Hyphomicrobium sp. TaxID=82 RepID=UPI000FBEA4A6|nr:TetR/AcrR family transcriptional regulator [Hyphomicrobium sp.]RUO97254.1 MAG: TetR/AcrR family transcriptional regulator [Hyphomicrobium sp.]